MSYILEALKKSEYARQQGRIPDLTTLPAMADPTDPERSGPRIAYTLAAAAAAVAVLVTVFSLWRPWEEAPAEQRVAVMDSQPVTAVATSTPAERASTAPTTAPPSAQAAQPQTIRPEAETIVAVTATPAAPLPEPSVPIAQPKTRPGTPSPAAGLSRAAPAPDPVQPEQRPVDAVRPVQAAPPPQPPVPPDRVLTYYELPDTIRAGIPAFTISGFSYTDEPRARMAVINDRILHEGEHAGNGVTIERIASDGIVLNYKGFRFRP